MKTLKLIFFLLMTLFGTVNAQDKMNICFLTINSSEEKHVFQKQLSTGKNAEKFAFHELATPSADNYEWESRYQKCQ